jgi:hypothetical protein
MKKNVILESTGPIYKMDVAYHRSLSESFHDLVCGIIKRGDYYQTALSSPAAYGKSGTEAKSLSEHSRCVFYVDSKSAKLINKWVSEMNKKSGQTTESP